MKGIEMKSQNKGTQVRRNQLLAVLLMVAVGVVCLYFPKSASSDTITQATFATPGEASQALLAAARKDDQPALARILGPDSKDILSSGDAAEDRQALEAFAQKFDQMSRWVKMTDGSEILTVGADNFSFPIPLVQDSSSTWRFDTKAGAEEILVRRIGRNELLAIDAISAIGNAEELYAQQSHDGNPAGLYTTKIFSTPGKHDGLFWKVPQGQPPSPLGHVNLFASDALSTPNESPVIDGYSFRILTAQGDYALDGVKQYVVTGKMTGGFAVIASPVKYLDSGVMTFILNQEGVVYQQDLGDETSKVAASIVAYNPTSDWEPTD
jgi:hypothetical protein